MNLSMVEAIKIVQKLSVDDLTITTNFGSQYFLKFRFTIGFKPKEISKTHKNISKNHFNYNSGIAVSKQINFFFCCPSSMEIQAVMLSEKQHHLFLSFQALKNQTFYLQVGITDRKYPQNKNISRNKKN